MFIPNSPSPPRGITLSVCVGLLKKCFSPSPNLKSYHTVPLPAARIRPVAQPFRALLSRFSMYSPIFRPATVAQALLPVLLGFSFLRTLCTLR
jgi:hypothetical protein